MSWSIVVVTSQCAVLSHRMGPSIKTQVFTTWLTHSHFFDYTTSSQQKDKWMQSRWDTLSSGTSGRRLHSRRFFPHCHEREDMAFNVDKWPCGHSASLWPDWVRQRVFCCFLIHASLCPQMFLLCLCTILRIHPDLIFRSTLGKAWMY